MINSTRSYQDPCGIARALDVIGERWALLIVRELVLGPKRFTDMRDGLSGASPNVISQRLRDLERSGVIQRKNLRGASYELTEWGRELRPLLVQMGRWGARSPSVRGRILTVDALMLALESTFDPSVEGDFRAKIELILGEERFLAKVTHGSLAIARGTLADPDVIIETDSETLRAVAFGDQSLKDAAIRYTGDKRVAKVFLRSFVRPKPAQ